MKKLNKTQSKNTDHKQVDQHVSWAPPGPALPTYVVGDKNVNIKNTAGHLTSNMRTLTLRAAIPALLTQKHCRASN